MPGALGLAGGRRARPAGAAFPRRNGDAALRAAADQAGASIAATFALEGGPDAAWLLAIDAVLTGGADAAPIAAPTLAPTPAGERRVAECLAMVSAVPDADVPRRLLALLAPLATRPVLVDAVYGWLRTDDPDLARATLAWLAGRAATVRQVMRTRGATDLVPACERLILHDVCEPARNVALEATAWLLTRGADPGELRDLLGSDNGRWATRALAELLFRPAVELVPAESVVRTLTAMRFDQKLLVAHRRFDVYFAEPMRVLAALALARAGEVPAGDERLAQVVQRHCGVAPAELPRFVADAERAGTLARIVDALEFDCRRRFGVPAELVWPRSDGR